MPAIIKQYLLWLLSLTVSGPTCTPPPSEAALLTCCITQALQGPSLLRQHPLLQSPPPPPQTHTHTCPLPHPFFPL
jgi:hypothetical protein